MATAALAKEREKEGAGKLGENDAHDLDEF